MNSRLIPFALGLVLMTGASVAHGQGTGSGKATVDRTQEEAALRAADLAWAAAAGRKDLDATVAFMAADGETLAPNEPAATDPAAIRKAWASMLAPGSSIDWKPVRVQVAESGELGFASGTYTTSSKDASGNPVDDRGKYLEVWKKVDGDWKCLMDMFSSDLPAQ
jgi:ketosteroid isomerase-like protein